MSWKCDELFSKGIVRKSEAMAQICMEKQVESTASYRIGGSGNRHARVMHCGVEARMGVVLFMLRKDWQWYGKETS